MQDRISQADGSAGAPDVEAHVLSDDGVFPNNSELPLLLYRQVLDVTGPDADQTIARVPLPKSDPLAGPAGALMRHWIA